MENYDALKKQIADLEKQLAELRQKNEVLERRNSASQESAELPSAISEFEETLRRLVQRTAMIVQAEKCVIMVRDREADELVARAPAFGMTDLEVKSYRVEAERGISGEVYMSGKASILHDAAEDPRALVEHLPGLRIRNGVTVPLVVEKRDDENRLVEQVRIGVLHCFNKRYGAEFIDEDVRLLERLSRNAAAVIANAQMYQEVVAEKQKLVHTLESLTAGLILINQHGRISQMNAQARQMFGVPDTLDPLHKMFPDIIKDEECLAILKRKIDEANNPRPPSGDEEEPRQPDEITISDEDGNNFVYQVHAASVRDDDNQPFGIVVIFNDITDLRAVMRMKTEFVSIVSHELRTPLTPMKGFIRTLLDDENEEWYMREDRREFYGIIEQNVDRLSRLINDLLNVSRIERGAGLEFNWAEVDLRESVEEAVAMQKGRTDKHQLIVDFEPEHIVAETDPDLFQNILHNLLSNAIKYAPDGGEVRVIGRVEPATDEEPETVVLGVKDQGLGMTESELKKVGTLFQRAKSSRGKQGTGIGLYLVTNIVRGHNGKLIPESDGIGKGATFWFRFPRKQPEETTQEKK
jgi:PAS domain S-box-containing protein